MKHYTSKLSSYDDLTKLTTFGFRGEALSSLCALSKFHIVTAGASDGPKGTRLDFESSGKLKSKSVIASQKGTSVVVEDLFFNLPVRRKELEKNIKREYGKVLSLLHAYACISTGVKLVVSNVSAKGSKTIVFATNANSTTRENIANVYGAKALAALLPLNLKLEMSSSTTLDPNPVKQSVRSNSTAPEVRVEGHISRPVVGEGRQAPDRQMFFVNSRPCALPQVAKAMNEVYRSYNISQSPFIFANLKMDTNAYDVNVSPDKRTILLHDQNILLEQLKSELQAIFELHDQSVPQAQLSSKKVTPFRPLTIPAHPSGSSATVESTGQRSQNNAFSVEHRLKFNPSTFAGVHTVSAARNNDYSDDNDQSAENVVTQTLRASEAKSNNGQSHSSSDVDHSDDEAVEKSISNNIQDNLPRKTLAGDRFQQSVRDFNERVLGPTFDSHAKEIASSQLDDEENVPTLSQARRTNPGVVQNAFDKMRSKRSAMDTAIITIGDKTLTTTIGTPESKRRRIHKPKQYIDYGELPQSSPLFGRSIREFARPGSGPGNSKVPEDGQDEMNDDEINSDRSETDQDMTSSDRQSTEASDAEELDDRHQNTSSNREPPAVAKLDSDGEYLDETENRTREEEKIAKMIAHAEETAAKPTQDGLKRAGAAMKGRVRKDSTFQLACTLPISMAKIASAAKQLKNQYQAAIPNQQVGLDHEKGGDEDSPEERLSLTVSKTDFATMKIVGQFNLGFILALRPANNEANKASSDELFIIDQHASDEKYNFERLQTETIVQNQRLVHPKKLELTAVDEEIILNNPAALIQNGFLIATDESGDTPVGHRCRLTSLPMSREVTFDTRDLEELLALLGEQAGADTPRPSKVRRMFAIRACRSSIMVGKTLTLKQMEKVVRHMGEIDKPWNCPHGRPTMRHLFGLHEWQGWTEGDGRMGSGIMQSQKANWSTFVSNEKRKESSGES